MTREYPWYDVVDPEEDILQGDFLRSCPIAVPPNNVCEGLAAQVDVIEYDVVVMSQSCDLAQHKVRWVLVCPFWSLTDFEVENPDFRKAGKRAKLRERLRQGNYPGFHLLNKPQLEGFQDDYLVVHFRDIYSVAFEYIIPFVRNMGPRLRLLPPYREHLSQAFARFFMRVGLPVDIPPFR